MKKKIMMVAALAGILSLAACVDDNESASVEAVRNAKAEQLKSVAAMNNATAEAAKLLAEADAALTAAKTEAQKIQNEINNVNVELAKANLEFEKARLEVEKANLEYRKEQIAADLKTLAANLERQLLEAKTALLTAQWAYNNQLESLSAQEQAKLSNLLNAYTQASTDLINAKQYLENLNINLISLENELVSAKEFLKKNNHTDSLKYNNEIAVEEAKITAYKKYSSVSYNDAKAAYDVAFSEQLVINNKLLASSQAYTVANTNENNARTALNNSAYLQKMQTKFIWETYEGYSISYFNHLNNDYYGYNYYKDGIWEYLKMFTSYGTTPYYTEWNNADGTNGGGITSNLVSDFYSINKTGFDAYIALVTKAVKVKKDAVATAQTAYNSAVTAEETAKTAADASGATQADRDAYIAARQNRDNAESSLNSTQSTLEAAESRLKELTDAYTFVTDETQIAAVTKLVNNYNTAVRTRQAAQVQYNKDHYTANIKESEVQALRNMLNTINPNDDIESLIARSENAIKDKKSQLVEISRRTTTTKEQAIAKTKIEITNAEAKVAKLEKDATTTKAALDAAMK